MFIRGSSMLIQFNREKTIQAMLYVSTSLSRRDFHTIFKILYFADRDHLQKWGRPITGDTYIAMEAGPVPSRAYDIVKAVRGDSYFKDQEGLSDYFQIESWMYVIPKKEADLSKLSRTDVDSLNLAITQYGDLSYDEIKEKSHDTAWRSTAQDYAIEWEQIARESGLSSEDISYIAEEFTIQQALA